MPHTKGPFVINMLDKSPCRILAEGDIGHALALVYLTDPETRKRSPEFIGNAHLFAAAPDMLAALEEAERWMVAELNGRLEVEALSTIRAAIAKAEGVSQ